MNADQAKPKLHKKLLQCLSDDVRISWRHLGPSLDFARLVPVSLLRAWYLSILIFVNAPLQIYLNKVIYLVQVVCSFSYPYGTLECAGEQSSRTSPRTRDACGEAS